MDRESHTRETTEVQEEGRGEERERKKERKRERERTWMYGCGGGWEGEGDSILVQTPTIHSNVGQKQNEPSVRRTWG